MARKNPSPRTSVPQIQAVERIILYVRDTARSGRWYRDNLGFQPRAEAPGWIELETRGVALCLHDGRTHGPAKDAPRVGLRVEAFDQAYKALQLREVPALGEPYSPYPGLRVASFQDPDGNLLSIEGP